MTSCTRKHRIHLLLMVAFMAWIPGIQRLSAQYCSVSFRSYSTCVGGNITNVSFAGIANTVPCLSGGGYRDFTTTVSPGVVSKGQSYPISVSIGGGGWDGGTAVWIDFDRNGVFDASEQVFTGTYVPSTTVYTGTVTIPATAASGITTMRVVGNELTTPVSPCGSQTYGEAQDYRIVIGGGGYNNASVSALVNLSDLGFCAGTQDVKVMIRNSGKNIINNVMVEWKVDGVAQAPLYWSHPLDTTGGNGPADTVVTLGQVSFASNASRSIQVWTSMPNNVPDTINSDDTLTVSLQPRLNCAFLPQACAPSFSSWTTCIGGAVAAVNFAGINSTTPCLTGGGYRDLTNTVPAPVVIPGQPYPVSITIGSTYPVGGGGAVWMDLNRNGTFEPNEQMFTGTYNSASPPNIYSGTITIPSTVQPGYLLMRVIGRESSTPTAACGSVGYGEANDYLLYVSSSAPNNAAVTQILPASQSFCAGSELVKARIKNAGNNVINNVMVNWSVDGVPQAPVYWSAALDTLGGSNPSDTLIDLGMYSFVTGVSNQVKVWTSMPNNVADTVNIDDTLTLALQPMFNCVSLPNLCQPAFTNYSSCIGGAITAVNLAGMNSVTPCMNGGGYRDLTHRVQAPVLLGGRPYPISVTVGSTSYPTGGGMLVWVDLNRNGMFEPAEQMLTGAYSGSNPVPYTYTGTITIPASVQTGYLLMRVIGRESAIPSGVCGASGYGEANDYYIYVNNSAANNAAVTEVLPLTQSFCAGTQDIRARIENRGFNVIGNVTVNWSVDGITQTSLNWFHPIDTAGGQSASDTLLTLGQLTFSAGVAKSIKVWTSYPNNTADTMNFDDTLLVSIESSVVGGCASYSLPSYCTPTFITYTSSCVGGNITNVTFAGINKSTTCTVGGNYYMDYTGSVAPAVVSPGGSYPISVTVGGGSWYGGVVAWIDFNRNGVFEPSESIYQDVFTSGVLLHTGTVNIPRNASAGYTVMRVLGAESSNPPATAACVSGSYYGEAQDYVVYINEKPANNASVTMQVAPKSFCPGNHDVQVRIANFGRNIINNVTVEWTLNGTPQPPVSWLSPIDTLGGLSASDTVITLGNISFPQGSTQHFKVWTSNPNFTPDTTNHDDTLSFSLVPAISGTFTVGTGGAYTSFAQVASDLNAGGICGNVIFEVAAGSTFNEAPLLFINPGNGTDSIIFRKSGTGANPVINCTGTAGSDDAAIDLRGARNVIFDGIDVRVVSTAVEYGYRITNTPAGGSSNNTIRNTRIVMNRSNTSSVGLVQTSNSVLGGGLDATSFAMSNHNNSYINIRVENSYNGILLIGAYAYPDTNCMVTSEGSDTTIVGAASANDIGNGTSFVYGIYFNNVRNSTISNCVVRNLTHTGSGAVQGIIVENSSSSGSYGNVDVAGNTVYSINRTSTTTSSATHAHGIRIELGATATAKVYNNVVYAVTSSGNTSSANANQAVRGISYGTSSGTGTAYFYNNSVSINNPSLNRTSAAFWKSGSGSAVLSNNIFSNTTAAQSGVAKHFAVYRNSGPLTASHNLLWVANTNGFTGYYGADQATMQNWRNASGTDLSSLFYRPAFTGADDLRPNRADTAAWAINGRGVHVPAVDRDRAGAIRAVTPQQGTPDIGAYEFTPVSLPPLAVAVPAVPAQGATQVFLFADDTVARITWDPFLAAPSGIAVRLYSGETPAPLSLSGHQVLNAYYDIAMPAGSYSYNVQAYYKEIWEGSIQSRIDLRPATKSAFGTWLADFTGTADTVKYLLNTSVLNHPEVILTGAYQYDPLPVKLLELAAVKAGNDVIVRWTTADEVNNKGFEVEYSTDGRTFSTAGFVHAGGSRGTAAYSYEHRNAFSLAPVLYYRIRQVDLDGTGVHSGVVMVKDLAASAPVHVFPNPFDQRLAIDLGGPAASDVRVTITDLSGRSVQESLVEQGSSKTLIHTDALKPGVYVISLTGNGINKTVKLVKQ